MWCKFHGKKCAPANEGDGAYYRPPILCTEASCLRNILYKCHSMSGGKEAVRQLQKYIKAPIVSWKNPFKNVCQPTFDDWMAEMEHEITPAG